MLSKERRRQAYTDRAKWISNLIDQTSPSGPIVGVEIGVWKADFSTLMLQANERLTLYGVDPYFEYGKKQRKQPQWDAIFDKVNRKMEPFVSDDRFIFVRKASNKALSYLPEKVDFVFVDGNHDEDYVFRDIKLYEPLIRSGGFLAGHDYYTPKTDGSFSIRDGVGKAVDKYAKKFKRKLHTSHVVDPYGVFWWIVP